MTIKDAVILRINFNILFVKIEKLSKSFILLFSLFHSVTVDEKYEFLKRVFLKYVKIIYRVRKKL